MSTDCNSVRAPLRPANRLNITSLPPPKERCSTNSLFIKTSRRSRKKSNSSKHKKYHRKATPRHLKTVTVGHDLPSTRFTGDLECLMMERTDEQHSDSWRKFVAEDCEGQRSWVLLFLVLQKNRMEVRISALNTVISRGHWNCLSIICNEFKDTYDLRETERRSIFTAAVERHQWDVLRALAKWDLYEDQVREVATLAVQNEQWDLLLHLVDLQYFQRHDVNEFCRKALKKEAWDVVQLFSARGASLHLLLHELNDQNCPQKFVEVWQMCSEEELSSHKQTCVSRLDEVTSWASIQFEEAEVMMAAAGSDHGQDAIRFIWYGPIADVRTLHDLFYQPALRQKQKGVIRALIKRSVQSGSQFYRNYFMREDYDHWLELINIGMWSAIVSLINTVFTSMTAVPNKVVQLILDEALRNREWTVLTKLIHTGALTRLQRKRVFQCAKKATHWELLLKIMYKYKHHYAKALFRMAREHSNWEVLCEGVQHGANINQRNANGDTSLHQSVQENNTNGVTRLLLHGADCNIANNDKITALHAACQNGAWDQVCLMIKHGGNIHQPNPQNQTPFKVMLSEGRTECLQSAVDAGCDVMREQACADNGTPTALHHFLRKGFLDSVTNLLKQGHDPKLTSRRKNLLQYALFSCESAKEDCILYCLRLGLTASQLYTTSDTSIKEHIAITAYDQSSWYRALMEPSTSHTVLKMLVQSGAVSRKQLQQLLSRHQSESGQNSGKVLYLREEARMPTTLLQICRSAISLSMGCCVDRVEKISTLPIPVPMKRYLNYSDLEDKLEKQIT